jgi:hypothetical protein
MPYYVITRQGWGTVLVFDDARSANLHPVTQYGDAVIGSIVDLLDQYNRKEWRRLCKLVGYSGGQDLEVLDRTIRPAEERLVRSRMAPRIMELLGEVAKPPPDDLPGILAMVASDRTPVENNSMSDASTTETDAAKPPRSYGGFRADQVVQLGKDANGNPYGPDNNPYKPGSNRAVRFSGISNGMTVEQVIAIEGYSGARFKREVEAGHITVQ